MRTGHQVRQRCLHQENRAAQVDPERLVPPVYGEGTDRFGKGIGRVVHHDVDTAELLDRGPHQLFERMDVTGVRRHAQRPDPQGAQVLDRLRTRLRLAACHNNIGPRTGIPFGKCTPDSASTAGHNGGAPREIEQAGEGLSIHRFRSLLLFVSST